MTSPVAVATRENTVDDCMAIMTKHRFRHLPVVEYSSAVVVVSISDLVKWIISGQAQTIQGQWKVLAESGERSAKHLERLDRTRGTWIPPNGNIVLVSRKPTSH